MKKHNKLITLLLALVMAMAMTCTAFAANIEITNPQKDAANAENDATYSAYKVFSLSKAVDSDDNTKYNYSYYMDGTSKFYAFLTDDNTDLTGIATLEATTQKDANNNIIYNANVTDPAAFAALLKGAVDNVSLALTPTATGTQSGETVVIDVGSNLGYYFVNTTSGTVGSLTTVDDQLTITDKNEKPVIHKTVDDPSAEVGQTVNFTITGEVPDTTGYNVFNYDISDTMSTGLTFTEAASNLKVKIGNMVLIGTAGTGETAAPAGTVLPTVTYNFDGFTAAFDMTKYQTQKGQTITVTYSATVNTNAVVALTKNSATVEYSNNPADATDKATTPPTEVEVYSSKIIVHKYEENNPNKHLAGAEFVLVKKVMENTVVDGQPVTDPETGDPIQEEVEYFYKLTGGTTVTWVTDIADATPYSTGNSGTAEFIGLEDGTYYLRETVAPAGYNRLTSDVEVRVAHGVDRTSGKNIGVAKNADVENSTGAVLPNTGSFGTIILTGIGVIAIAAGILLTGRKKAN